MTASVTVRNAAGVAWSERAATKVLRGAMDVAAILNILNDDKYQ